MIELSPLSCHLKKNIEWGKKKIDAKFAAMIFKARQT